MPPTRREFLRGLCGAGAALTALPRVADAQALPVVASAGGTEIPLGIAEACAALRSRFPDLRRRFLFEYYPWYGRDPWRHWEQWGRRPPDDLAANYFPRLGAYDSRDMRVLARRARGPVRQRRARKRAPEAAASTAGRDLHPVDRVEKWIRHLGR